MAPKPQIFKAFRAMKALGIPEETTKPVLKKLLKLYDGNWELIEQENYRVLADAIFDNEEEKAVEQKKKLDNSEEETRKNLEQAEILITIEEDTKIQEELERPLKRLRSRNQENQGSPSCINPGTSSRGNLLKKPKLEVEELPESQPKLPSPVKTAVTEPVSRINSQPVSPLKRSKNKGKQPILPNALIKPKEEPLTDGPPRSEVPHAVVMPESLTNGQPVCKDAIPPTDAPSSDVNDSVKPVVESTGDDCEKQIEQNSTNNNSHLAHDDTRSFDHAVLTHGKLFEARHNTTAYLVVDNAPVNQVFTSVISFLLRSQISYALTVPVDHIYEDHMIDFWSFAVYHCDREPHCITAIINDQELVLTEDMIREVLHFEDSLNVSNDIPRQVIDECLHQMGSIRPKNDPQIRKHHVCPHWKFLEHTLIGCLSARKGGLDGMSYKLAGLMVALIQNRPFNFSHFIFTNLVSNINNSVQFYMFPRFLQRIFDERLQNLPRVGNLYHYTPMQKRVLSDCRGYRGKPVPPNTPLFGHVIDEHYLSSQLDIDMDSEDESSSSEEQWEIPIVSPVTTPLEVLELMDDIQYHEVEHLDDLAADVSEVPIAVEAESFEEAHVLTMEESVAQQEQIRVRTEEKQRELRRKRHADTDPEYIPEERQQQRRRLRPVSRVFSQPEAGSSSRTQENVSASVIPSLLDTSIMRAVQPLLEVVQRLQAELINACKRIDAQDQIISSQSISIDAQATRIFNLEEELSEFKDRLENQNDVNVDDNQDDGPNDDDQGDDDGNDGDVDVVVNEDVNDVDDAVNMDVNEAEDRDNQEDLSRAIVI